LTPKVSDIILKGFLTIGNQSDPTEHSPARPNPREVEIIRLLAEGKANKEIAAKLGITIRTVETHRAEVIIAICVARQSASFCVALFAFKLVIVLRAGIGNRSLATEGIKVRVVANNTQIEDPSESST